MRPKLAQDLQLRAAVRGTGRVWKYGSTVTADGGRPSISNQHTPAAAGPGGLTLCASVPVAFA